MSDGAMNGLLRTLVLALVLALVGAKAPVSQYIVDQLSGDYRVERADVGVSESALSDMLRGVELPPSIRITDKLPGEHRAVSEEDLADLIKDNLEPDLLPWQPSSRPQGGLTALDFLNLLHEIDTQWPAYRRNFLAIVAIRNNTYSMWSYPTSRSWCIRRVKIAGEEFTKYVRTHNLSFPDVMYVMNGYDKPLCPIGNCSAPLFSFGKCWQPAMPSIPCMKTSDAPLVPPSNLTKRKGFLRPGGAAPSISLGLPKLPSKPPPPPALRVAGGELQRSAWGQRVATLSYGSNTRGLKEQHQDAPAIHQKHDRQEQPSDCWQAAASGMPASSTSRRSVLSSGTIPPSSPYEDILFPVMNHPFDYLLNNQWDQTQEVAFMRAGLYAAMAHNCSRVLLYQLAQTSEGKQSLDVGIYQNRHWRVRLKTVPPVPILAHVKYRYLINTDGQAASWRLAKLLAMSSLVLKWKSPHIEYYYRSLHPGVHYEEVDERTVLSKLQTLRQPDRQQRQQEMAAEAQRFAFRYLSQLSRSAYARTALAQYRMLFKPGEMDKLLNTLRDDGSPSMLDLLLMRQRLLVEGEA